VTLRTFTVSVQGAPAGGFTRETGFDISGTLTSGQSVTITDTQSRFGTKPYGEKPLYWIPNATNGQSDTSAGRAAITPQNGSFVTDVKPTGATGAWRFDFSTTTASALGNALRIPDGASCYLWLKKRYNFTFNGTAATEFNMKMCRIWALSTTNPYVVEQVQGSEGSGGNPRINIGPHQVGDFADYGGYGHRGNSWDVYEYEMQPCSALNVEDGIWAPARNGILRQPADNRFITRSTGYPAHLRDIFLDDRVNSIGSSITSPPYVWYGPIYVDDSRCRVFVSSESTFQYSDSGTEYTREIQLPTAWAANSVTFTMRAGALSSFSGQYLYVVKSDGTALKIGRFT
jgi:hypothetical protein